ncbi:NAD(P)-binding protein [Bacillus alveayuensis]|jgi:precorrin-2 dehydrogenase/sirohydrochlorin ferrochelatase|uniref:NAD(P)-binding protein n=1 Tax=Aeribacillus alveayuensis TaxID=279215 RepID=UPI0005D1288E|nr:NAD(P)-binding protein [Bacillus alveayuensis]
MMHYPAMLNLTGKKAVVVGGGQVAARKVQSLLKANAEVTVISPTLTEQIRQFADQQRIVWREKPFEPRDIRGAFLVIAATNSRVVNDEVLKAANEYQLINIVDDPSNSNFIVPAVFQRGKLVMSISTSGAFPGLAKQIKRDLEKHYDDRYEAYLSFLESSRKEVIHTINDDKQKRAMLKELLHPRFLQMSEIERQEEFQQIMKKSRGTS